MQRTYDRIAARYADRDVYPMTQELAAFLSRLPQGSRVIDIGCGTGEYARMMAGQGYRVTALDLSKGMLVQAHESGTPGILRADMLRLPFADRCADGCFLSASLLHIPRAEVPRILAEVRRVLRDAGVAFLSVKVGDGHAWMPEPEGGARFFVYYRPAALDRLLLEAGLSGVAGWTSPPGEGQAHAWIARVVQKVPR